MKSSGYKVLLTTLLLTTVVIWLKMSHKQRPLYEKDLMTVNPQRNLLTKNDYVALCIKENNVTLGYLEAFAGAAGTVDQYISNLTYSKSNYDDIINDIIVNDNNDEVQGLVIKIFAPYIIIAVFGILTIIIWLVYCICCCKQCLCCKAAERKQGMCSFKGISFIIMLVALAGIIAVSIIGWIFSKDLPEKIESMECALLKFYTETKEGESKTTTPRWIGITGVSKKLKEISNSLDEVYRNSQDAFRDTDRVKESKQGFMNLLDKKYNENSGTTIANPNPQSTSQNVAPVFIKNWGPKETQITTLGQIKTEYDVSITGGMDLLRELKAITEQMNDQIIEGKRTFDDAQAQLEPLNAEFVKFETDYIGKFQDFVRIF